MQDESMYNDDTLERMMNESCRDLVSRLWSYTLSLEDYVIQLRIRINDLCRNQIPYPDPASDFALRFIDHPSYSEFNDILDDECCFDPIRD